MSLATVDFDYVSSLVLKRSAIVLEPEKNYLVESRLSPIARQEGYASVAELVAELRSGPKDVLRSKVVEAMTTNETSFYRDLKPFEAFQKVVVPELLLARAKEKRLQIWCGASSTGQEPYTIGLVLKEHFGTHAHWQFPIIATDLSLNVLERARQGRYTQLEVNRGLPAPQLVKYFTRQGTEWQLKDEVRKLVEFRQLNLIDAAWGIGAVDVVFLRNVLIYFDVATKKEILRKIRQILRPDGFLFLGGAETTMNLDDHFERIPFERSGCYRLRKS